MSTLRGHRPPEVFGRETRSEAKRSEAKRSEGKRSEAKRRSEARRGETRRSETSRRAAARVGILGSACKFVNKLVVWRARCCQGLPEARFCKEFVNKLVVWGARCCQGLPEARFCKEFVNKFVVWGARCCQGSQRLGSTTLLPHSFMVREWQPRSSEKQVFTGNCHFASARIKFPRYSNC